MCYMAGTEAREKVGVRELRQNLSVYLERVEEGAIFEVTDRGRSVALLRPLPADASAVERLVASGRAQAARGDLVALGRQALRLRRSLSEALSEIRDDRL